MWFLVQSHQNYIPIQMRTSLQLQYYCQLLQRQYCDAVHNLNPWFVQIKTRLIISNEYEFVVIFIGLGEVVTCSSSKNSKLFYAVLGGLGQFGVITRARIPLGSAPRRVKFYKKNYIHI